MKRIISFGAIAVCLLLGSCCNKPVFDPDKEQVVIGENIAVANTVYGKVRGFICRGIFQFRGIPYAAPAGGENRFMPPQKLEPWEGVKKAYNYGDMAPQPIAYDRSPESAAGFVDHWNYFNSSEDCLRLNVWTPALDAKKRPVLVWLHGGGFSLGSGIEQDGYNGESISRYGDIVFVSVNHRLNSIGYSDLAKVGGEKYAHSGNVGMLDIVAALQWVHDNIENFGGDPGNVTIMGQSGGGSKVSILASMPACKGLIHKGVALSGNSTGGVNKEYAEALGEYIVAEAGLQPSEIDKLQEMPWEEYYALAERACRKFNESNVNKSGRAGFNPVGDGIDIPEGEFYNPDDETLPDIPMLFCSTFHEWNPNREDGEIEKYNREQVIEQMTPRFGDRAAEIFDAYDAVFPDDTPVDVWALTVSTRHGIVHSADVKKQQTSPVYMAWFGWCPPLFDGHQRASHCMDICFWLHNTDLMITHCGGGLRPRKLSTKMTDALLAFMRTGNPNCKGLPKWPEYTSENGELMVLNDVCYVANDPDREARKVMDND